MFRRSKKARNICIAAVVLLILAAALPLGCGTSPSPQGSNPGSQEGEGPEVAQNAAADFYKGKTVNFIVPFNAGGGFDSYARLVAPFLEEEIGARSVLIENIPGGGSIIGTNQFYNAEPDGLTFAIINLLGTIPSQLLEEEGVHFDLKEAEWVVRLAPDPQVLVVSPDSKIKSFEDFLAAKTRIGSTSTTGSSYVNPVAMITAFELQSEIVTGFEGSSGTDLAVIRGDVDATMASASSKLAAISNGELNPILVISEEEVPELADVPNAKTFAETEKAKGIVKAISSISSAGRAIALPPGVTEERVEFLCDAFMRVLENPELLERAERADMPIGALRGDVLAELVQTAFQVPDDLIEALSEK